MPWYYAGSDSQPVGPLSAEELQARRASGAISLDTYIIEHTGSTEAKVWKRYREVFPAMPATPTPLPAAPFVLPPTPAPKSQAHPLFPSAAMPHQAPVAPAVPFKTSLGAEAVFVKRKTNPWCAWGFGLALAGCLLSFACVGLVFALPALIICFIGIVQVQKSRDQAGHGLALAGLVLACLAIIIALIVAYTVIPLLKAHELTTTEQSANDAD